ncbi:MAG: tryptophan 2,3-dioxygenase [Cytophagales bacterium]|nr:tryptophan 2,3-dioxygenase [Cytophagales bacterium]
MEQPLDPKVLQRIQLLEDKFKDMGQDLASHLDGLLYSDYLKYWGYIHLDTLLSIQQPRTDLPDEVVFIIYHQITELYFRLIIWELEQVAKLEAHQDEVFLQKIQRINLYFGHLKHSFEIMEHGMEQEQFLKFRMSLYPASGFQSIQFRLIEVFATEVHNLVHEDSRHLVGEDASIESCYEHIYWKRGATDLKTGQKSLSLVHFEKKYSKLIVRKAKEYRQTNVWTLYKRFFSHSPLQEQIIPALRRFDQFANVTWPLAHYKSAARYLLKNGPDAKSTGGTNWKKYLPPKYQRIVFFPELWSKEELDNWGKNYIVEQVLHMNL